MFNKRLTVSGSVLILLGVLIPVISFFLAFWQGHTDPTALRVDELLALRLVVLEGEMVFECEETGEILPEREFPTEADFPEMSEEQYERYAAEHLFRRGRLEIEILKIAAFGLILIVLGAVIAVPR